MPSSLEDRLKSFGQEHLLAFWNQLNEASRDRLRRQIESVDLELVRSLTAGDDSKQEAWADLAARALPPAAIRLTDRADAARYAAARSRGEAALAAGEVGVIIVAGGQGTRLGFPHPKGMFPIGPVSQATLFQILLEKTLARGRAAGKPLPVYLMTSPATHDETVRYLEENDRFGLPAKDVKVFCQGTMPAVDAASGKLLLAQKDALSISPDGHGGMLGALVQSGVLADARRRGLKYLFYVQIDNPAVAIGDPEFLGYHIESASEASTQVVAKRSLRDKVGNVVETDGRLQIIEYSDLNPLGDEVIDRRTPDGEPIFWAGSIAVHVFDVAFLERAAATAGGLPFHKAHKAVPYVEPASGTWIEPSKPNAIKFERFIFDLLPSAERAIVYEVDWQRDFAPVKNAPIEQTDTPATVQAQLVAQAREWLVQAGAKVAPGIAVEIRPTFALDAAQLKQRIEPGLVVDAPRYFS